MTALAVGMETFEALPRHVQQLKLLAYVHMRNIHGSTGAGRTARQVVEHLAKREDVDLRVLADKRDHERIVPVVQEPWNGFRYHTFAGDTSQQQARWFFFDRPRAESYWQEADVVYCTAESYVPVSKAKLAVTAHDAGYFESDAHQRDARFWAQRLKWEMLFKKLQHRVDMFHTVSDFSAERLAHYFPQITSRIRCVHNGVTPHFFTPETADGAEFVKQVGLSERPYVLVPGGLHFRKNAELILSASADLLAHDSTLIIAVVNHCDPAYKNRAASLGPRFCMLGFVPDEALKSLYMHAQVVWYPSRYEGFGLPVVEAMACGAPVVASNAASIPEIAGDAALLVDAASTGEHVDAIRHLLRDDGDREALTTAGKRRATQFTWTKCAAELNRHFRELL